MDRTEQIWSEGDIAKALSVAPEELYLALMLALWTGQRQGDLLKLSWTAYDDHSTDAVQDWEGRLDQSWLSAKSVARQNPTAIDDDLDEPKGRSMDLGRI